MYKQVLIEILENGDRSRIKRSRVEGISAYITNPNTIHKNQAKMRVAILIVHRNTTEM